MVVKVGINVKMQNPRKEDNAIRAYVELEKDLRSCMRCKFFYGSNRQCLAKKCVKEESKREITEHERERNVLDARIGGQKDTVFPV